MNWNDICIKQYYELQEKQTFFSSTIFFSISTKVQNLGHVRLYLVFKNTPLNHMTDCEFSYYQEAEKACASFNQTNLQEDTIKNIKGKRHKYYK